MAVALLVTRLPTPPSIDDAAFDLTARLVRALAPRPLPDDVVIVGIDEAAERQLPEPFAMWHEHLGAALAVIGGSRPAAIGLDVTLPDRSFDGIKPGLDEALARGLAAARRAAPLTIGLSLDAQGRVRPVSPLLVAAAGEQVFALAYAAVDDDGIARRFVPALGQTDGMAGLAERIAQVRGAPVAAGWIDFSAGAPFRYVSLVDVLRWRDDPAAAARTFGGRVVLIGSVLPDVDRVRQPVSLAAWEPDSAAPPGVILQAQTLRVLLAGALLQPVPMPLIVVLTGLTAVVVSIRRAGWAWIAAVSAIGLLAAATMVAYRVGWILQPAAPMTSALVAAVVAGAREAVGQRRARAAIERRFAGYVSPSVLEGLLSGEIDAAGPRKSDNLAFLFADIRGFSALSERLPAEEVVMLLNRYYQAMTAAIHACDGMVDNFRGDGLMAVFGAPKPLAEPSVQALAAARDMFERLARLNRELAGEGRPPIAIGIGIAAGEAVTGNVGSADRHDYTAIGDAVNVAARLQALCKARGMRLIATAAVVHHAAADEPWLPLGMQEIAGHTPVAAFGLQADDTAEYSAAAPPNPSLSAANDPD